MHPVFSVGVAEHRIWLVACLACLLHAGHSLDEIRRECRVEKFTVGSADLMFS